MGKRAKILVAMSGGIDSSVAAHLLIEAGYEVIGATLHLWVTPTGPAANVSRLCCSIEAIDRAKSVAAHLGIPHYVLDYTDFFEERVVQPFCDAYVQGHTPNPCVRCNRLVKFGKLLETARQLDIDYLATGHYAQVERDESTGLAVLKRGVDPKKDQSYMLCCLTQAQLSHVNFPLGGSHKRDIQGYADRFGDLLCDVPESQEVCFVTGGNYRSFVTERLPEAARPGPIFDETGGEVGKHDGIAFYTVGQRKGLGMVSPHPLYVTRIDVERNALVVGPSDSVYSTRLRVTDVNWIGGAVPDVVESFVQIRHRHEAAHARLAVVDDTMVDVEFSEPQHAVTPGQTAAFYVDDVVLGGGTIGGVEHDDEAGGPWI